MFDNEQFSTKKDNEMKRNLMNFCRVSNNERALRERFKKEPVKIKCSQDNGELQTIDGTI